MDIHTGFLQGNLFDGWDQSDIDGLDANASAARYAEMCRAAIEQSYPGATVTVEWQADAGGSVPYPLRTRVDGDDGHDDVPFVDEICSRVFSGFGWLVDADAAPRAVRFFTAWEVHAKGLRALVADCDPADTVWSAGDGGYAVGDVADMPDFDDDDVEYTEVGTVADYLREE